jgi:hypothetical protein
LRRCRHAVVRKNARYAGWNIVVEKNSHQRTVRDRLPCSAA